MKLLNILIVFVLIYFCVSTLNADVYIWTDKKGVKHYSDHPPENGEPYEIQKEAQPSRRDEEADNQGNATQQEHIQDFIKSADENYEKRQQAERLQAQQAEKNQPPTKEEKIAAEKEKLENKISELEAQPLEYFGSQRNKIARIGFYHYRLEALIEDPDKYFKNPESFEGNIKEPE